VKRGPGERDGNGGREKKETVTIGEGTWEVKGKRVAKRGTDNKGLRYQTEGNGEGDIFKRRCTGSRGYGQTENQEKTRTPRRDRKNEGDMRRSKWEKMRNKLEWCVLASDGGGKDKSRKRNATGGRLLRVALIREKIEGGNDKRNLTEGRGTASGGSFEGVGRRSLTFHERTTPVVKRKKKNFEKN